MRAVNCELHRVAWAAWLACAVATATSCRPPAPEPERTDGGPISHIPILLNPHVTTCTEACGNDANPPTGGPHCDTWLACRKFDTAQQRCEWIHNLEHGHAVLAYNCPAGCPEIVSALAGIWDSQQGSAVGRRILLTPDPQLPRRVAAVVWAWSYSGDEVDEGLIREVLSHQDKEAPEAYSDCAR